MACNTGLRRGALPPALKEGQQLSLSPGGPCLEVWKVNCGWAEVRVVYRKPKLVMIEGREPFYATKGAPEQPISAHSFVYPCQEKED